MTTIRETTTKKTSIDIIDNLPVDIRKAFIARTRADWNSLSKEQKVNQLDNLHQAARGEMRSAGGMLDHEAAILKHVNETIPKQIEQILQEMEKNSDEWDREADKMGIQGYREIARFLRDRRADFKQRGIEALDFDIHLVDQPSTVGAQLIIKDVRKEHKGD